MFPSNAWILAVSPIVVTLASCSSGSGLPTSSPTSTKPPAVTAAAVLVRGIPVAGVVRVGSDEPSLFQARVNAPGGLPSIGRVVMEYAQPGPNHHGGSMMGGFRGTVMMYDDGTHGDDIAFDGIYHFMDPENQVGCHGITAPRGEYRYSFWCEDVFGQRSAVAAIVVERE